MITKLYFNDYTNLIFLIIYIYLLFKQVRRKEGIEWDVGTHDNDVWGSSYFTTRMMKMALRCGFLNLTKCTGQGKRSQGISTLVNCNEAVPLEESMRASRHNCVEAHRGYIHTDEVSHAKRYRAFAGTYNVDIEVSLLFYVTNLFRITIIKFISI